MTTGDGGTWTRRCRRPSGAAWNPTRRSGRRARLWCARVAARRDPLAAALAAGETPSPELVASAGEKEGLDQKISVPCLLVVMLCAGRGRGGAKPAVGPHERTAGRSARRAGAPGARNCVVIRIPAQAGGHQRHPGKPDRAAGPTEEATGNTAVARLAERRVSIRIDYRESQSPLEAAPYGR